MTARCYSAFECSFFTATGRACDICQKSHDEYLESERNKAITLAKRLLEHHGYTVVKKQGATT